MTIRFYTVFDEFLTAFRVILFQFLAGHAPGHTPAVAENSLRLKQGFKVVPIGFGNRRYLYLVICHSNLFEEPVKGFHLVISIELIGNRVRMGFVLLFSTFCKLFYRIQGFFPVFI